MIDHQRLAEQEIEASRTTHVETGEAGLHAQLAQTYAILHLTDTIREIAARGNEHTK